MNPGSMEERSSSSCAIGVPLSAATAPGLPANVRVQAPPLPRQLLPGTADTANTDHRIPNDHCSGSGEITAIWDVGFLARNPNGAFWEAPSYKHATVSVYYKNQLLSEGVFPEIRLPSKKTKSYTAKAVALGKRIDDGQVADAIARDWSQGVVTFTVGLLNKLDGSEGDEDKLNVTCMDIKVAFSNHSSSQGTMLVGPQYSPNNTDQQAFTRCSSLR